MPRPTNKPPQPAVPEDDGTLLEEEGASPDGATMVFDTNAFAAEDSAEQSPDGATLMLDAGSLPQARRPAVQARLKVTAGPRVGEQFDLGPGETVIGRQNDCTIVLADISVSRRHVLVVRDGAACKLRDLGSGNGTFYNGERLEGEVELKDGDVFVMGDSEVTFSLQAPAAPRAAPPRPQPQAARPAPRPTGTAQRAVAPPRPGGAPLARRPGPRPGPRASGAEPAEMEDATGRLVLDREAPKKNRRKKLLIATAVMAVLVGGLVAYQKSTAARQQQDEEARKGAELAGLIEEMASAIEAGKEGTKTGNFRAASNAFTFAIEKAAAIEELGGDSATQARDAKNRLEYAKKEIANQETVEKVKEHLTKNELALAVAAIATIPDDSFFYDKIPDLKSELNAKIPEKIVQARGLLASRNLPAATAAVEDVLAVDAANPEAKKLSDDIVRAGAPKPAAPKPVVEKVDYTAKALAAFQAGKIDEAIGVLAVCEEVDCAKLADKITAFKAANDKGSADALKKCKAIPGCEQSPYYAPLAGKAAGDLVREGIKLMGSDDYCKAFKNFYEALKAEPNNAVATKHMATIHTRAKELFQQAYVDKGVDAEKARREFEQVICMTAADDELNQKSQRHLKSLGGGY